MNSLVRFERKVVVAVVVSALAAGLAGCAEPVPSSQPPPAPTRQVLTTRSPGRPAPLRWQLPTPGPDQASAGLRMGAIRDNVRLDVVSVFIRDDQVTLVLAAKTGPGQPPLLPQEVALGGSAGQAASRGQPVWLGGVSGLSLSGVTLRFTDYTSPVLNLSVTSLGPGRGASATPLPFEAAIPLLVNGMPNGRPQPEMRAFFVDPSSQLAYPDGTQVVPGDGTQAPGQIVSSPRDTGGVTEFQCFTLRTPAGEEQKIYVLTMADGTVQAVTRDAYLARLQPVFGPPPLPANPPIH